MTGQTDPEKILSEIHAKYPSAKVILTLGEEGAVYSDGNSIFRQDAFRVKAVDTTAAGDTFTGYFIASILQKHSPEEGLKIACKASSITVTRPGALDSIPVLDEVLQKM